MRVKDEGPNAWIGGGGATSAAAMHSDGGGGGMMPARPRARGARARAPRRGDGRRCDGGSEDMGASSGKRRREEGPGQRRRVVTLVRWETNAYHTMLRAIEPTHVPPHIRHVSDGDSDSDG